MANAGVCRKYCDDDVETVIVSGAQRRVKGEGVLAGVCWCGEAYVVDVRCGDGRERDQPEPPIDGGQGFWQRVSLNGHDPGGRRVVGGCRSGCSDATRRIGTPCGQ